MRPPDSDPPHLGPALSPERESELRAFLEPHGIEPSDWALIDLALTHSSHTFENDLPGDNERLEFLGDAVLGLLVSLHMYSSHEASSEGELSKLKAQLVSRSVLGRVAFDLKVGPLLRLGRGEEQTGGRKRLSLLGSALEALVGAIYLDLGLEAAHRFIAPFLLNVHATITQHDDYQDYKSELQEAVQRLRGAVPRYETVDAVGPDHDKTFLVQVVVDGEILGSGRGSRVKSAENRAAREALGRLGSEEGASGG